MIMPGCDGASVRDCPIPPPAVFLSGAARVREDEAILGPGVVELLLRAPLPASSLRVTVGGQGSVLRATGLVAARPAPDRGAPRFAACPIP